MIMLSHSVDHSDLDSISRLISLVYIRVVLIGKCSSLILDCDRGEHIKGLML